MQSDICKYCNSVTLEINKTLTNGSKMKMCSNVNCTEELLKNSFWENVPHSNIITPLPIKPMCNLQNIVDSIDYENNNVPQLQTSYHQTVFSPIKISMDQSSSSSGIISDVVEIDRIPLQNKDKFNEVSHFEIKYLPSLSPLEKKFHEIDKWPAWKNKDNLCWLDVLLMVFCHNSIFRRLLRMRPNPRTVIHQLLSSYDDMLQLLNPKLRCGLFDNHDIETRYELESRGSINEVVEQELNNIRYIVLDSIIPNLKNYKIGDYESPVNALSLLLRNCCNIYQFLKVQFTTHMECSLCGEVDQMNMTRDILTIPRPKNILNMKEPIYFRKCPKVACKNLNVECRLTWNSLPGFFVAIFPNGFSEKKLKLSQVKANFDFEFNSKQYKLSSIVQYMKRKNNDEKDHFVAWIRNYHNNNWMRYDDLNKKSPMFFPKIPLIYSTDVSIGIFDMVCLTDSEVKLDCNVTSTMPCTEFTPLPRLLTKRSGSSVIPTTTRKRVISSLSNYSSYQNKAELNKSALTEPIPTAKRLSQNNMYDLDINIIGSKRSKKKMNKKESRSIDSFIKIDKQHVISDGIKSEDTISPTKTNNINNEERSIFNTHLNILEEKVGENENKSIFSIQSNNLEEKANENENSLMKDLLNPFEETNDCLLKTLNDDFISGFLT